MNNITIAGGDETTCAAGTLLTFAPGVTSQTVSVAVVDDTTDEAPEPWRTPPLVKLPALTVIMLVPAPLI